MVTWLTKVNLYDGWLAKNGVIAIAEVPAPLAPRSVSDVDKATEERHRGSSDTCITQEPPPGDVILDRIDFIGFCCHLPTLSHEPPPFARDKATLAPCARPLLFDDPLRGTSWGTLALTTDSYKGPQATWSAGVRWATGRQARSPAHACSTGLRAGHVPVATSQTWGPPCCRKMGSRVDIAGSPGERAQGKGGLVS